MCLSLPAVAADDECPTAVKAAVEKTFPGATLKKCKSIISAGKQMYAVKLQTKDGDTSKMVLDPAGLVLRTQEFVTVEKVPAVVMKTFKGTYEGHKVVKTEKWTYPDGKVTYRVTYLMPDGSKKSSTVYTSEGVVVEEQEIIVDEDMD